MPYTWKRFACIPCKEQDYYDNCFPLAQIEHANESTRMEGVSDLDMNK